MKKLAVLALAALIAAPALAADTSEQELVGTWKRDDGKVFRIDWDSQAGELTGTMLDPPENSVTHLKYAVALHLHRDGDKVRGKAVWTDFNPKKGQPNQPDFWTADSLWEFDVVAPGKLKGRSEYLSFGRGKVFEKDWDNHDLEKLPVVTLGASGVAPEKVEAAQPIDDAALAGTWKTSAGSYVQFRAEEKGLVLEQVEKGTSAFPKAIRLTNDANLLHGVAEWDGGVETKVELRLATPGRLDGRTESVEGASRGWAPLALEKLPQIDAPATFADVGGAALAPSTSLTLPSLTWKRDDGTYLKLAAKEGGRYEGDLLDKTGKALAHVVLGPDPKGEMLIGTATFTLGDVEQPLNWWLALRPDGTLEGHCEWRDVDVKHGAAGAEVTGFMHVAPRKFKALRRVG